MHIERNVRLFRNGSNQAIRIPKEFELDCDEAVIHKEGDRLIVNPLRKGKLLSALSNLKPIDEAFPDIKSNLPALDNVNI